MSSSSNASSNTRSSHSNTIKALIAAALRDYNLLQTDQDRKRFLVENSYLFARDKFGCQILQTKISDEV
jgi:hypothetical protein